ncbi:hypothetical protein M758_12G125700 [Ceratodon purpureus]|nr:hypothetical protein M758_12G125700 [Ceratodon purpureus]
MEEEKGRLSLEGTLKKNQSGVLPRISQALRGLLNSLDEFRELESILGCAAEADHICSSQTNEGRPSFLHLAVATLKDMVAVLVSEIEVKPEIQKLLLLIQNSSIAPTDRAFFQDAIAAKQPSCQVLDSNPKLCESKMACNSAIDLKVAKRVSLKTLQVGCRHTCEHHAELMDRSLWSKLPKELLELVLACLPMPQLVEICRCPERWSILSKSPDFRHECSKRHPKIFGLVGRKWNPGRTLRTVVYDIKSNDWCYRELGSGFPPSILSDARHAYDDAIFACDGGLVCYVAQGSLSSHPILVGNPLTDEWRALPWMPLEKLAIMQPILVQLVMEDDEKSYRVNLVSVKYEVADYTSRAYAAHCYDSKTGLWSAMESGLVYDGCRDRMRTILEAPCVFDCETKTVHGLLECPALEGVNAKRCAIVKDRLFVLHKWSSDMFPHVEERFIVSEYEWQSSASDLSRLRIIDSTLPRHLPGEIRKVRFFSCKGFLLLFADSRKEDEDQHQIIRLFDSSLNDWQNLSMGGDFRFTGDELQGVFMCELRWDAVP